MSNKILSWNKWHLRISEAKALQIEKPSEINAVEIEYYKRRQLGDSKQEAIDWVTYRKTKILWEFRRDHLNAEI